MVVISDKILRIALIRETATTAALYKLNLQEKALERQISELKSSSGTGGAMFRKRSASLRPDSARFRRRWSR